MNRDEKGRFVKGNKCGNRFKRSNGNGNGKPSEDPRINGKKGGESHGKVRLFKDIAVEMLSEEVELPNGKVVTLKDVLMNSLVKRARDNDKSLELLLKIGGEFPTEKHDVNVTSPQGISIFCGNDEELAALHRQLKDKDK